MCGENKKVSLSERELKIIREALEVRNGIDSRAASLENDQSIAANIDKAFDDAVKRAENGEPLAYVIGEWYFYGLTFRLNRACLIPRPDTEHIVDACISELPHGGRILEPCTGSGCIAISVLKNRTDCICDAVEISSDACKMAELNAELNGVKARFDVANADIFKFTPSKKYDIIASNPPYIRTDVIPSLDASVKEYEPTAALDGGEDGMRFYRYMLTAFSPFLTDGGKFIFEIGYDQKERIEELALSLGYGHCSVKKDYGGNYRVAIIEV